MMNGKVRLTLALTLAMTALTGQAARDSLLVGIRPDGTELWAEEHHFDKRIERFDVMPDKPQLCLNFIDASGKGSQELALYDVLERRLRWIGDFDFALDRYVMTSRGVVAQMGKETILLDDDGNRLWTAKFCPLYCDEESGMLIAAKKASSKDILGISLADGTRRWKGSLAHRNGLNEVQRTDDGRLLFSSDQLGLINPVTGEINVLDSKTAYTRKDSRLVAGMVAGGVLSLIGAVALAATGSGYYAYYTPGNDWSSDHPDKDVLHGLSSNILQQDGRVYYADRKNLWCLDAALKPLWQVTLPHNSSTSSVWMEADTLFYVNYGMGFNHEGAQVEDTEAYALAFDRRTGEKLYDFVPQSQSLFFLKSDAEDSFTPLTMTFNDLSDEDADIGNLYVIERQLGADRYCIHSGYDYWIVDAAGHVRLRIRQPIVQTAWIGNLFVALNAGNSIFQFNMGDL